VQYSISVELLSMLNVEIFLKSFIYCKTLYFRCILISRFWNVEFHCILIWHFPSVLLVFTRPLMGKLNFRGYLISRFYPTREIREYLMHAKNVLQ